MHHVVNCLVSPDDPAFDKTALNPCKGIGTGAISDATDQKTKEALQSALEVAKKGIQANTLDEARNDARQVADMLKSMETGGK